MPQKRSWTDDQLVKAVKTSTSYRAVIKKLNLIPAGGNYDQVKRRIFELTLQTDHFLGMGWNKGMHYSHKDTPKVETHLTMGSSIQSFKLKKKLIAAGLKQAKCEICGWCKRSQDGRIPVELDHINGDHSDNRLENLRVLCPNCHSLQPTHRGRNKRVALRSMGR